MSVHLFGWSDKADQSSDATNGSPLSGAGDIGSTLTIVFAGGTSWIALGVNGNWGA